MKAAAVTNFPIRPMSEDEADQEVRADLMVEKVAPVGVEELPLTDDDAQCHPLAQRHRVDGGQPREESPSI